MLTPPVRSSQLHRRDRPGHVTHLFETLSATNRVQPAIAAFRAGLVE